MIDVRIGRFRHAPCARITIFLHIWSRCDDSGKYAFLLFGTLKKEGERR